MSNYLKNFQKLVDLNLNLPFLLPFKWPSPFLHIWGTKLSTELSQLNALKFASLMTSFRKDISKLVSLHGSWMGHYNAIKQNFLPKFLLFFQALPIKIPSTFFSYLKSLFTSFIWVFSRAC